jgi:hypothetical protein
MHLPDVESRYNKDHIEHHKEQVVRTWLTLTLPLLTVHTLHFARVFGLQAARQTDAIRAQEDNLQRALKDCTFQPAISSRVSCCACARVCIAWSLARCAVCCSDG